MIKNYNNIYFVGIGGIGMSSMAELLHNLKYNISGSDLINSERTKHLKNLVTLLLALEEEAHLLSDMVLKKIILDRTPMLLNL